MGCRSNKVKMMSNKPAQPAQPAADPLRHGIPESEWQACWIRNGGPQWVYNQQIEPDYVIGGLSFGIGFFIPLD